MNDSEVQFPIGTTILYKPRNPDFDNARYIGQKALITRYLGSKKQYIPAPLRDCFIKFSSGVVLLVPKYDIVLPEER